MLWLLNTLGIAVVIEQEGHEVSTKHLLLKKITVYVQAPVGFALGETDGTAAPRALTVFVRNKNFFTSTAGLRVEWRLLADGAPAAADSDRQGSETKGWQSAELAPVPPQVCARPKRVFICLCFLSFPEEFYIASAYLLSDGNRSIL